MANAASVTDYGQVEAMVAEATGRWGSVDILVANAGILRDKTFAKMSLDDFRAVIEVHLMGGVNCAKAVWDGMRERNYGRIVFTTSSSGLYGNFGQSNYGAAKMALVGLMQTLSLEGARHNIRVNCLAPTAGTRMLEGLMPEDMLEALTPASGESGGTGAGARGRADAHHPVRRRRQLRDRQHHAHPRHSCRDRRRRGRDCRQPLGCDRRRHRRNRSGKRCGARTTRAQEGRLRTGQGRGLIMRDAVIVSTARTPIGRAYRGAFNATQAPTLAAHAIRAAVERAKLDPAEIDDCVLGCAMPQGSTHTIGRTAALRSGLPVTVAGMTIDRQCSSGLMAIATAAKQVIVDRMDVVLAGGVESISLVQTDKFRLDRDPELVAMHDDVYMPMLDTAETVARRYGIGREEQDAYGLMSQQRTAAAQAAGRFDDEIVPVTTIKAVADKATGAVTEPGGDAREGRGQPAGNDDGRPRGPQAGAARGLDHGRQRQPAFGRRLGLHRHGSRRSPKSAGSRRSAAISAWRSPAPSPTRWASARSSPCRSCSSASI